MRDIKVNVRFSADEHEEFLRRAGDNSSAYIRQLACGDSPHAMWSRAVEVVLATAPLSDLRSELVEALDTVSFCAPEPGLTRVVASLASMLEHALHQKARGLIHEAIVSTSNLIERL